MPTAEGRAGWLFVQFDLKSLTWFLFLLYLAVDAFNGLLISVGIDLKLAQLYKAGLTFLALYVLISWRSRSALYLILGFGFLLIGPLFRFHTQIHNSFLIFSLPTATRILLLFSAMCFAWESFSRYPNESLKWAKRVLWFGAAMILVNVLLGHAGFGFYAYESTQVGYIGFFLAGNEVSAVFGLVYSFVLHEIWRKRWPFRYVIVSVVVLFLGVSIATKASVIFSILAIFLVPIFNLREKLFGLKAIIFLLLFFVLLAFASLALWEHIQQIPIIQRVMFVFDSLGFWGVLLSKRDELALVYIEAVQTGNAFYNLFLGTGPKALIEVNGRLLVELDPIDITIYFGVVVGLLFLLFSFASLYLPLCRIQNFEYAPCLLLVNFCFLFFAIIAGHIWTSGMLGGVWGIFMSLVLVRRQQRNEDGALV